MRIATTYPVKKRDDRKVIDMRSTRIRRGGGTSTQKAFSGTVYLAGKKFTVSTSATWVVVNFIAATVTTSSVGPSDPFPPGEEWYYVPNTVGDIHVARLGG